MSAGDRPRPLTQDSRDGEERGRKEARVFYSGLPLTRWTDLSLARHQLEHLAGRLVCMQGLVLFQQGSIVVSHVVFFLGWLTLELVKVVGWVVGWSDSWSGLLSLF